MEIKKYFVIGNPIDHSLSPKLQNHWLKENNINATYEKIKLEENEINNFFQDIKKQKIIGCNVTVPFKKKVLSFLDKLSPEAEQTQSVNTIIFNSGYLVGHNTDIIGFERAIKSINFDIKDKKIVVLGAGGVVPSIIFALKKMGAAKVIISNRTRQHAENLKTQFNDLYVVEWGTLPKLDVIINATSLGLKNETINIDFSKIGKNKLFYDVIYNPAQTSFLKQGKDSGNLSENGKLMFVYQASEAFKLWHGIEPKINADTLKLLDND